MQQIELHILHKFACEKCYEHTHELVSQLKKYGYTILLKSLDGDLDKDSIRFSTMNKSICMYIQDSHFKYLVFDGHKKHTANNIDSIITILQEQDAFYYDLYLKYQELIKQIFDIKVSLSDEINQVSYHYFYEEPYTVTFLLGFSSLVDEDRRNEIIKAAYSQLNTFDGDYNFNIRGSTRDDICSSCRGKHES